MTEKHSIKCSVVLLLITVFSLNICHAKAGEKIKKTSKSKTKNSSGKPKFIYNEDLITDYSFADEALPVEDVAVARKMERSLKKHNFHHVQSYVLQKKAAKLFPVIEPILKAHHVPDDFKYMALVESGFGDGTSPKGARGLWQFLPGSARTYGLKVGHGVDERMDIKKSTVAACKYLKELHAEFRSWTLAAAAYNNGEIKLARSMRQQKERDYFKMHLNHETGIYVYNLVAMKAIISQPRKYGYKHYYASYYASMNPSELLVAYN
ncbi:MAG TPA: lytic transglycosylase domain-containing protein [Mucilaginibacter sp.]|jgi:membrane-bound lytic murein transglycosylase MltF